MKALTDIPFARETAALIWDQSTFQRLVQERHTIPFIVRMIHFENRYKTIDQLLSFAESTNILELSSGFSARGLAMAKDKELVYIDTDLPDSSANKKELISKLVATYHISYKGKLHIQALNAMDEEQFNAILQLFPPGPITIVNEGLLVYLDQEEKRKLCAIIHRILRERGGYWITGDVYTRSKLPEAIQEKSNVMDKQWTQFLKDHRVDENKFETYEEAEAFFESCDFRVFKKAKIVLEKLSALQYLPEMISDDKILGWMNNQQTWMLAAV